MFDYRQDYVCVPSIADQVDAGGSCYLERPSFCEVLSGAVQSLLTLTI